MQMKGMMTYMNSGEGLCQVGSRREVRMGALGCGGHGLREEKREEKRWMQ